MIRCFKPGLLGLALLFSVHWLNASVPIMPLSEIRPGMIGTWETVVEGTEIRTFQLRVLGISPNFIGPRQPVILCEALDPDHKHSGPVAGMSGSPVFIDGRLIGAYAYGYLWPKDQAIIGVTPIEEMLPIIENYPPAALEHRYRKAFNNGPAGIAHGVPVAPHANSLSPSTTATDRLPFPVYVSGIRPEVLAAFEPEAAALGITWSSLPAADSGPSSNHPSVADDIPLTPGMPIAGVLMGGDFSFTGVGTVTWRDGQRVLGFGHPFFGAGDVEIPMAGARVMTVVRSVQRSFKLSEVGPVVGSIYQDRLTGIAGEIGRKAPTIDVRYNLETSLGGKIQYQSQLFEHPRLSPLLAAMALLQSLQANLDTGEEQTLHLNTRIEVEGYPLIHYSNTAVGGNGAMQLAVQLLRVMGVLTDNPFEFPRITSLVVDVKMVPNTHFSFFDEVAITSTVPAPGETLDVRLRIRNYLGQPVEQKLSIPIPLGTKRQTLTLQIADANQVDPENQDLMRPDMDTLGDIIGQINRQRSQRYVYIRLLRQAKGLRLQGDTLYDLPPSVSQLYNTPKNAQYSSEVNDISLWETRLETDGVFVGSYRLNVEIK